jgi:hypothetical protein
MEGSSKGRVDTNTKGALIRALCKVTHPCRHKRIDDEIWHRQLYHKVTESVYPDV